MSEAKVIDNDVAVRVPFPERGPRVDRRPVLSREEIDLAVAQINGTSPIVLRDRAILQVLSDTGIRNSELRALTIEDADFADRTLLVRNGKGKKMRIVPMDRAAAALEQYVRDARPKLAGPLANGALFVSRERRPLSRKTLEGIERASRAALSSALPRRWRAPTHEGRRRTPARGRPFEVERSRWRARPLRGAA